MTDDMKKVQEREAKWQKRWRDAKAFVPKNDGSKPRYYNLIEFPFPSGSGLHVGHMLQHRIYLIDHFYQSSYFLFERR